MAIRFDITYFDRVILNPLKGILKIILEKQSDGQQQMKTNPWWTEQNRLLLISEVHVCRIANYCLLIHAYTLRKVSFFIRPCHIGEAEKIIFQYIVVYYNRQRKHSANGYKSPAEYENEWWEERVVV